jgi:hypothetical protein
MESRQQKFREWVYLLPTGETAKDMREGCQIMADNLGHRFGSHSFRLLVKKGVIKQVENNYLPISANSDGNTRTIQTI